MKEKELIDELSTFPEWDLIGKKVISEVYRMGEEQEFDDSEDDEAWCSLPVLEKAVWYVSGELEDEMRMFLARLIRVKCQYELEKRYRKDFDELMKLYKQ